MIERHHHANMQALATTFADFAASTLRSALRDSPAITLVVPGGQTPRAYLPALSQQALPWKNIHITLSDERWVEAQADASNERLVRECLLINEARNAHLVGLKTPHLRPSDAVATVHERLTRLPAPFSLTILGLGEDGHIASLFPGVVHDPTNPYLCQAVEPPIAPSSRISLTLSALADSCHIAVVVTGAVKRQLLDQLIESPDPSIPFAQLIRLSSSPITIFETN